MSKPRTTPSKVTKLLSLEYISFTTKKTLETGASLGFSCIDISACLMHKCINARSYQVGGNRPDFGRGPILFYFVSASSEGSGETVCLHWLVSGADPGFLEKGFIYKGVGFALLILSQFSIMSHENEII